MQIPMSYKVESYQESLFMGFPLKQSLHMLIGMAVMAAIIAVVTIVFKLNVVIATYAGLPFAAPIVMAGFPDATGMTIIDKMRKKREIKAYGKNLVYGTGLTELLIRNLAKKENNNTLDAFNSAVRKVIVMGIAAGVIAIAAIVIIIMKLIR